jgi:heterodisulfide reductase subunit A
MRRKIGTAMVVGAGIGGIRSALDLAEFGYRVTLVDKAPHLGGILSQLDYQFPNDGCGMCKMLPLVDRDASSQYCLRKGLFHENITIVLGAELTALEGEPGNFSATVKQKPTSVDPGRCIGCGQCTTVCPIDVPDAFNMGLGSRKAIYLPVPHNIPNTYVIDFVNCTRCGECVKVCPTDAIKFPEERRKKFHILVVDDELIVRDSLKEWLDDEGFSVGMAESGQAALDQLAQKTYHLMLTDIKMPGMDGVEVLKQAKERYPDLTIVMMTAYATVETAIEAMKTGALDYLLKPFDPKTFTSKILEIYQGLDVIEEREIQVNALVFSAGTDYIDLMETKNTYGYGIYPDVVGAREFERLLSGTGPAQGTLLRRSDRQPVRKVAWFQCIGSRDLQLGADLCSSVCCMHAVKEARLVKEKYGPAVDTAIFYMDMRAFGKTFYQYLTQAKDEYGIRFERSRVHTVIENKERGGLAVSYFDRKGTLQKEQFDMIVLSTGQRPSAAAGKLVELAGLNLNAWGFCDAQPFSTSLSNVEGIYLGGSFTGLKDIAESIIQSGSAALNASRFIHSKGGSLSAEPDEDIAMRDISREQPQILVMVCRCGQASPAALDEEGLKQSLIKDPAVAEVCFSDRTCAVEGWTELASVALKTGANRILIGACMPYAYTPKIRQLAAQTGVYPALIHVTDIRVSNHTQLESSDDPGAPKRVATKIKMGLSRLKRSDPPQLPAVPSVQKALVVGGGIAGMTAALAIADHGYPVDLIEQEAELGGNLAWLQRTIEGHDIQSLLEKTKQKIEQHPLVHVHTQSTVAHCFGGPGQFMTTIENKRDKSVQTVEHGAALLATGGAEARTSSYGYGRSTTVVTHKELNQGLAGGNIDPQKLSSVVMIQCVDSRENSKKNYCSRFCCISTLKHALHLKEENPALSIYVLYRDLMAYGFFETFYSRARQMGIVFIQYDLENPPVVTLEDARVVVTAVEPILDQLVKIDADLVVLATGVVPTLPKALAEQFGVRVDTSGFFEEAESKWRPVDALKEGVFACGLCHSPRNITETISSAEAAAQRALRLLADKKVFAGTTVAQIHHSLCSLCQRCIETCPYQARRLDPDEAKVVIDPIMCQGCGSCAAVCPNSASILAGFKDQQVFDIIDSVFY